MGILESMAKRVVQIGRMVPRKGVDNAIRGFARLVDTYRIPARMLVVGGESDTPDPFLTPEIGRLQRRAPLVVQFLRDDALLPKVFVALEFAARVPQLKYEGMRHCPISFPPPV